MQLSHERPDYAWVVRGADARHVRVNDRVLERSFALAPDHLFEDWAPPASAAALEPARVRAVATIDPTASRTVQRHGAAVGWTAQNGPSGANSD